MRNREIAKFLIPERVMHPYEKESEGYLTALLRAKKISNATNAFASFGSMVMVILVAFIGGTAVVMGSMTYSSLLALVMVIPGVSSRLFWIPNVVATWHAGVGRSEPMMAFLRKEQMNLKEETLDYEPPLLISYPHVASLCAMLEGRH